MNHYILQTNQVFISLSLCLIRFSSNYYLFLTYPSMTLMAGNLHSAVDLDRDLSMESYTLLLRSLLAVEKVAYPAPLWI
jgi:hypothetical protein